MNNKSDTKRLAEAASNLASTILDVIDSNLKAATKTIEHAVTTATKLPDPLDGWVMQKEVMKHCNISRRTLYSWIQSGLIPCIRIGPRNIRFKLSDVDAALKRRFQRNRFD